jgi:hypothetical protein
MVSPRNIVAVIALLSVAGCGGPGSGLRPQGPPIDLAFESLDGGEIVLSAHRRRAVVLHVFSTWAPASHSDADELAALHRARSRDVVVIGLAIDREGRRFVAPWRSAVAAPYLIGLAGDDVRDGRTALGQLRQVPATFVLDARGRIVRRIERPLAPGEILRLVDELPNADR